MITFTEAAQKKILALIQAQKQEGLVLRFGIDGRGPGGFQYRLGFVGADDRSPDDTVLEGGGFQVLVDAASAPNLSGVTVDHVQEAGRSGFKIDNPHSIWSDPVAAAVQQVLDTEINPAVAAHGGYVALLEVKEGVAYIQLGGGCQGCGMVDVTLKQGIEVRIREAVPSIREIVDSTDHAGGKNPYYQPSKGGRSPLE